MNKISVNDYLPKNNQYVLIHLTYTNWLDDNDLDGCRYWTVAKLVKGISQNDRDLLSDDDNRKGTILCGDEDGNNKRSYVWEEFGPSCHFGQDVDFWCELPK
tara:strand:+ start:184 stop:489 length:306 start_codon:yes stop_codon:yes gene_type:complete